MNFLCFGVGAIGTYIGGSLALSGARVVFVERPEIAAEVRLRGLRLAVSGEERSLSQPEICGSLAEALERGPYDAALLAVKSFDTPVVVAEAAQFHRSMPPILSLQNGVENEPAIAASLGADRVVAGTVTTAVGRRAAGDIVVEKLRGTGVAVNHPLGVRLVDAFNTAGLRARAYPDAKSMKWSKMLTNLLANASSAILDMTPAQIFSHTGLYRVEVRMLREALAVMAAQQIPVSDLPATPVRLLVGVIQRLPLAISQPLVSQALGKGRGAKMPSFHIDLHAGRGRSEVDFLNGAVVRTGASQSVATPVNAWLTRTLTDLTDGKLPKDQFARQPERFIEAIQTAQP